MRTTTTDRIWIGGGALVAVVLLAVAWFVFISPQNATTESMGNEVEMAEAKVVSARERLVELRKQNENLDEYLLKLERDRAALPVDSGMPDFLRHLQAAGDKTGVAINGLVVGSPTKITVASGTIYYLPLTLNAAGSAANLESLLNELQQVQPRAALMTSVDMAATGQSNSLSGELVNLTVNMWVFVTSAEVPATTPSSGSNQAAAD